MTYDECKAVVEKMVSAPENIATEAMGLLDSLKNDYESMESLKQKVAEYDTKIRSLQDANTQLFLRLTDTPEPASNAEVNLIDEMMKNQFKDGRPI